MPVFQIHQRSDWNRVFDYARGLNNYPKRGFQVSVQNETRTDAQNRLLWDLLGEFEKQKATIRGREFTRDAWKAIFMNACGFDSDMLPTLDGKRFFAEGYRSSKLKVPEMTLLLERIFQEGAERGIKFRQTRELDEELPAHRRSVLLKASMEGVK